MDSVLQLAPAKNGPVLGIGYKKTKLQNPSSDEHSASWLMLDPSLTKGGEGQGDAEGGLDR